MVTDTLGVEAVSPGDCYATDAIAQGQLSPSGYRLFCSCRNAGELWGSNTGDEGTASIERTRQSDAKGQSGLGRRQACYRSRHDPMEDRLDSAIHRSGSHCISHGTKSSTIARFTAAFTHAAKCNASFPDAPISPFGQQQSGYRDCRPHADRAPVRLTILQDSAATREVKRGTWLQGHVTDP